MSEPRAKSRWRTFRKYLLLVGLTALIGFGAVIWYVTTDSFQALVRRRVVAELERVTGGQVNLGGIHTIPFRFQVEMRDLTIHGREPAREVPYAHVDHVVARIKVISTFGAEFGFSSVVLDRPVVHIISYPDGTTNQPARNSKRTSNTTSVEQLFSLSISQLEVRRGELLWNDQGTPLDFTANDVSADMTYSFLHRQYNGNLLLGKIDTRFENFRPIAWMAEAHFILNEDGIDVRSFKATSGRSRLQGSGRLVNFRKPNVVAKYDLNLDLAEASAIAHRSEIRQGIFHATGEGAWSAAIFSSTGQLSVKNFEWRDKSVGVHGASLGTDYTLNPQRFTFSKLQAALLGGEVVGVAEIVNWFNPTPAAKLTKVNAAEKQKGIVRLRLKNISVSEIAAALSTPVRPLRRLKVVGAASGTIDSQWRGSIRNTQSDITMDVAPLAQLK